MPLNKTPGAAAVATPAAVAPAPVATAPAAAEPKVTKRSLKSKAAAPVEAAVEGAAQAAAATVGLQPANMDPKEKRIQRSGIWQAVVQSNALVQYAPTLDAFLDLVDKAADRGLQYVNRS